RPRQCEQGSHRCRRWLDHGERRPIDLQLIGLPKKDLIPWRGTFTIRYAKPGPPLHVRATVPETFPRHECRFRHGTFGPRAVNTNSTSSLKLTFGSSLSPFQAFHSFCQILASPTTWSSAGAAALSFPSRT